MKNSIIDVGRPLSVRSVPRMEKPLVRQLGRVKAAVISVSGSTTVEDDAVNTRLRDLKAGLDACGHHCYGKLAPEQICTPEDLVWRACTS